MTNLRKTNLHNLHTATLRKARTLTTTLRTTINPARWRTTINPRKAALTAAGIAATTAAIATPLATTHSPPTTRPTTTTHPTSQELTYQYQPQDTYYYCAPAATRIATSTHGHIPTQDQLAAQLGTTTNGTNSANDTTRVLNTINGTPTYHTTSIPDPAATPTQTNQLQTDIIHDITRDKPIVANITGTATDTNGTPHSYNGGHYLTLVGYADNGNKVLIADPADPANHSYWMNTTDTANWIATRGYSS